MYYSTATNNYDWRGKGNDSENTTEKTADKTAKKTTGITAGKTAGKNAMNSVWKLARKAQV